MKTRGAKGKPVKMAADPRLQLPAVTSASTTAATTPAGPSVSTTAASGSPTPSNFSTPDTPGLKPSSLALQPGKAHFVQPQEVSVAQHVVPAVQKFSFSEAVESGSPAPQRITASDGQVFYVSHTSDSAVICGADSLWGSPSPTGAKMPARVPFKQSPSPCLVAQSPPSPRRQPAFESTIYDARSSQMNVVKSPQYWQVQSPQYWQVQSPQYQQVQSPQYWQVKSPQYRIPESPGYGKPPINRFSMPGPPAMTPKAQPVQHVVVKRAIMYY